MNITMALVCLLLMVSTGMSRVENPRRYCGRILAATLSLACDGANFEQPKFIPRPFLPGPTTLIHSGPKLHEEEVELVDEVEVEEQESRRSIIEVCCENPCYISQLISFCK